MRLCVPLPVSAQIDEKMTLSFTIDSMRRKSSKFWICTCAPMSLRATMCVSECERYLLKMNDKLCVINVCSRVVWRARTPLSSFRFGLYVCFVNQWYHLDASNAAWASWTHIFRFCSIHSVFFYSFVIYVRFLVVGFVLIYYNSCS